MKKRRQAYKRKRLVNIKTKGDVYKQVKKLANQANRRLNSLERHVKSGTWSSKILRNKLSSTKLKSFKKGRVKISPKMTVHQLINVGKALNEFLNSLTSTWSGIKQVRENTIDELQKEFDIDESTLTRDDYANIYDLLGESEFKDLAQEMNSSDLIYLMIETVDNKYSQSQYLQVFESIKELNDVDLRNKAIKLYNKLVPYIKK